jgi:diguanylate cyclase (GGDEF)-like protein
MALKESKALEELEYKAMKLVVVAKGYDKNSSYNVPAAIENVELSAEEKAMDFKTKMATAWLILFSDKYFSMKKTISSYRANAVEEIFKHNSAVNEYNAKNLRASFYNTIAGIILIVVVSLAFFLIIIVFVVNSLYTFIKSIKNGQKLKAARTKELELLRETYNDMFDMAMEKENLLRQRAEHDELTGLINRRAFKVILKSLKESKESVAYIMLDIDKFKEINDEHGHSVGDQTLKAVAQIISSTFRSTDYAARIGGDEFAVVLSKCDEDEEKTKLLIASKMTTLFRKLDEKSQKEIPLTTLSCGIAISKSGWNEELIEKADAALYEIKRSGRNGFKFAR